ncbi:MAG: ABC transporter ATP-binding protein [Methanosarcinales archaeon]
MKEILVVKDLHKSFGGVTALNGVSLSIDSKSIIGLIGPNGSGKTTLFNVITGFYTSDKGEVYLEGERINGLSTHDISLKGLIRTFQITRVFPKMTVLENMLVAPKKQIGEGIFSSFFNWKKVLDQEYFNKKKAYELLKFLEIEPLKDEYAGNLSGGQQKILDLGRVLMTDPKIVLLDEPIAGVNPTLAKKIFEKIIDLRNHKDMTFLIVEHNMDLLMNYCEKIYVMNKGQIVAYGTSSEIQNNEKVIEVYLGG